MRSTHILNENDSAFQVHKDKQKKNKNNDGSNNTASKNPQDALKELAKALGLQSLVKALDNFTYNVATKEIKHKKEKTAISSKSVAFSRTRFPDFSDVIIRSEDEVEFEAHKCILSARLDYFRSMFSCGWIEDNSQRSSVVTLPIPANLCEVLLDFLYTDFDVLNSEDPEFICNVLVMADQLLIPRLIEICERQLASLLTLKNVGEILQLANDFNAEQLKYTCKQYICLNLGSLLETKALDTVDMEGLRDISKHYQEINSALSYRTITPYSGGPSTEDIENFSISCDTSPEEIFEYEEEHFTKLDETVSGSNSSKKRRSRKLSTGSNSSLTASDSENENLNKSRTEDQDDEYSDLLNDMENLEVKNNDKQEPWTEAKSSAKNDHKNSEDLISSFFSDPSKFKTASTPVKSETKKFTKMSQKERKKQQQMLQSQNSVPETASEAVVTSNWSGWGKPPTAKDTSNGVNNSFASIMESEAKDSLPKSASKSPASSSGMTKRTRKPSWKSLSFDEAGGAPNAGQLATSPPITNPWKKLPPVEHHNVKDNPSDMKQILQEEAVQSHNLVRAQSKPLYVTQIEEEAIEQLKKFYNVDQVFDESITVDRVEQRVMATPVWKRFK